MILLYHFLSYMNIYMLHKFANLRASDTNSCSFWLAYLFSAYWGFNLWHSLASWFLIVLQDNWLLLTADYSQIELRLMAHFSKDSSLIELLSKPHGDVFNMIAARWTGCPEDSVGSSERDQTKRLVYGILYGMGANSLAEQLGCSPAEAAEKIQSFKSSFPGVASWLHQVVA